MKVHRQSVVIEGHNGSIEVVSFYNTATLTYGADLYYEDVFQESIGSMPGEPQREHLLSIV